MNCLLQTFLRFYIPYHIRKISIFLVALENTVFASGSEALHNFYYRDINTPFLCKIKIVLIFRFLNKLNFRINTFFCNPFLCRIKFAPTVVV